MGVMSLCSPVSFNPNTTLFLARSLDRGGAERQLVVLAKGLARRGHAVAVAVFFGGGAFETELAAAGVRIIYLGKKGRWDMLPFFVRLLRVLRRERPAQLHAYLSVPNLLAVAARPFLPGTRIVWGVRASDMDLSRYDRLSRLAYAWERRLARFADLIIANSQAGKRHAIANGFPEPKVVVVPNGIDTTYFRFDADGRQRQRARWGLAADDVAVGLVARLDPMKDHPTFFRAASRIVPVRQDVRFVCVGAGAAEYADSLKQQAAALGLAREVIWAGAQDDMPAVYSALDIACSSSSFGEGFSNTIAEAMACELPSVVTDVGDSAYIVGDAGTVVAPEDSAALAEAVMNLVRLSTEQRRSLGAACRARTVSEFGIEKLIDQTAQTLGLA